MLNERKTYKTEQNTNNALCRLRHNFVQMRLNKKGNRIGDKKMNSKDVPSKIKKERIMINGRKEKIVNFPHFKDTLLMVIKRGMKF